MLCNNLSAKLRGYIETKLSANTLFGLAREEKELSLLQLITVVDHWIWS